uniref:Ferrochelatase n=1 Tax=Timema genevievae TaxID=629358 RepID=A0A7R9K5N9_TIMGE|nr:unnamed protein product [Timema genevievae]
MNHIRPNLFYLGKQSISQVSGVQCTRHLSSVAAPHPSVQNVKDPKTGIVLINMGGPGTIDEVHDYLLKIMTDRDMIQLPVQRRNDNNKTIANQTPHQRREKAAWLVAFRIHGYQNLEKTASVSFTTIRTDLHLVTQLGPYIARRRTPEVQKKYSEIGGGSPILKWTKRQGELLCEKLDVLSPETAPHKYYVAFRYANPLTDVTLEEMEKDGLERAVLFSQYPQYCCSTTGSSFNAIYKYYKDSSKMAHHMKGEAQNARSLDPTLCQRHHSLAFKLHCPTDSNPFLGQRHERSPKVPPGIKWSIIDRWSTHPLLAKTIAERIRTELKEFPESIKKDVIIMFTAHSIPLKVVNRGDAYPSEVGATVQLVMKELGYCNPYSLVWQSKVGPLPWLGPFTDESLKGYVKQGKKNFILVPVAFVNEHIETLHELDIEYCHDLGKELGVENIRRAAAPNDHPIFIDGLTDIVLNHLKSGPRISPKFLTRCPHCTNARCEMSKSWFAQLCSQQ